MLKENGLPSLGYYGLPHEAPIADKIRKESKDQIEDKKEEPQNSFNPPDFFSKMGEEIGKQF